MRILLVGAALLAAGCGGGGRLEGGTEKPTAGTGGELQPSAGGAAGDEQPGTGGTARGGDGGTGAGTTAGGTGGTLAGSPGAAGHAQAGAGGTAGAASTGGSGGAGSSSGGQAGTTSAGGMPGAGTGGDGLGGSPAGAGGSAGAAAGSGGAGGNGGNGGATVSPEDACPGFTLYRVPPGACLRMDGEYDFADSGDCTSHHETTCQRVSPTNQCTNGPQPYCDGADELVYVKGETFGATYVVHLYDDTPDNPVSSCRCN